MDPDGGRISLQNKVQFDIRFHFCRRGRENMHLMQKSMFKVFKDYRTDHEYVAKIEDEATKNHRETDQPIQTNFMMENKGDKMCPVRSFKIYMSHLHPENPFLWQQVNHKPKDPFSPIWYTKAHMGKNILGHFMTELSKDTALSKRYTNHCIRVTGTSILTRCKFNDKEVMSMTGHKSVQSLTVYQRVQDKTKMQMGKVLSTSLQTKDDQLLREIENVPSVPTSAVTKPTTPMKAIEAAPEQAIQPQDTPKDNNIIVPFEPDFDEDIDDTDWLKILCEVEEQNANLLPMANTQCTAVKNTSIQRNSPMFVNCKIGNISINIQKK